MVSSAVSPPTQFARLDVTAALGVAPDLIPVRLRDPSVCFPALACDTVCNPWRIVAEIGRPRGALALLEGGRGTRTAPYRGLAEFIGDLTGHMQLERGVQSPMLEPTDA